MEVLLMVTVQHHSTNESYDEALMQSFFVATPVAFSEAGR